VALKVAFAIFNHPMGPAMTTIVTVVYGKDVLPVSLYQMRPV
jgi:hypothetical protein